MTTQTYGGESTATTQTTQKLSLFALTMMVVGGMVGAGIFSLPRTFAGATGPIGAAIAWLIFDNYTASTLGDNFSQIVFNFKVSPALLWSGIKWALAIGFIGGLFPAVRAARLPVTAGLREL